MRNLRSWLCFLIVVSACSAVYFYISNSHLYFSGELGVAPVKASGSEGNKNNITTTSVSKIEKSSRQQMASSEISSPGSARQEDGKKPTGYIQPSVEKYSAKIPALFRITSIDRNINYNLPVDDGDEHMEYFKRLSDQGDPIAKALYANRLVFRLSQVLHQDYLMTGGQVDIALWNSRFEDVRKLLIESAVAGYYLGAAQLTAIPSLEIVDKTESLSWALIADKIEGQGGHVLPIMCKEFKEECTDELLVKALDRALFYIDLYGFKAPSTPADSEETLQ